MGEEKKEEEAAEKKKDDVVKEEKKEEEKKKEEEEAIVLRVDMHCEACARKVARALKGFEGVEEVTADCKASKVVVKGKGAEAAKVSERIKKKTGRKVEIISPLPKQQQQPPKEDDKPQENKEEPKQENKDEPPAVVTVVLKVRMHCEACAQVLQKRIGKIKGVESVTTDIANDQVQVKGTVDPEKLVNDVYKRTGKQATVVKNEEKKEEEEKKDEEKKEEKQDEKKEAEESKEDEDKKTDIKKMEHWPSKYYMEYSYAPQMFSDENPNACAVM